jgi:hypothetical protein
MTFQETAGGLPPGPSGRSIDDQFFEHGNGADSPGPAGEPEAVDRLLAAYRNYLNMLAGIWLHHRLPPSVDCSDVVQDCRSGHTT